MGVPYFLRLARQGNRLVLQWQEPENKLQPDEWTNQPRRVVLEQLESSRYLDATRPHGRVEKRGYWR